LSALKNFQARHGASWASIVNSQAFAEALTLANLERIKEISQLSDEEIAGKAHVLLADLRGHFRYENALLTLHEPKDFVFQQELGEPDYPDPISELNEQIRAAAQKQRESADEGGPVPQMATAVPPSKPKPKKRSKR
jgi:hypothetical protein